MIRLYYVKNSYISYLRKFEPKVLFNKAENRPYVGVLFKVNDIDYYLPLASPKPKYATMGNSKDFHKIAGGKYGAINFNNMIPVPVTELVEIAINNEPDISYRSLLQNQLRVLNSMKDILHKKATDIYALFVSERVPTPYDENVKRRCCNFPMLEQKMQEYNATTTLHPL